MLVRVTSEYRQHVGVVAQVDRLPFGDVRCVWGVWVLCLDNLCPLQQRTHYREAWSNDLMRVAKFSRRHERKLRAREALLRLSGRLTS